MTKEYSTDDRTWTASGDNGCTVEVPTGADADYARYTMTITTPSGAVTTYDGRMDDSYAKPYTGKVASNYTLEVPLAKDWYQMVYKTVEDGVESEEVTITRYSNNMPSISESVDTVLVKLIDYRKNESTWATVPNLVRGDRAQLTQLIEQAESMLPNADQYVEEYWPMLLSALDAAKVVMDSNGASQEEIDEASQSLLTAILNQRYKADKSELEEQITRAETLLNTARYTAESMEALNVALEKANAVMANENLSEDDQAVVDSAAEELKKAVDSLMPASDEALAVNTMPETNAAPQDEELVVPQDVTWTVEGATSKNTTIDQEGNLTVAAGEEADTLIVRATSVADPSKSGIATVVVTPSKELLRKTYEYGLTLSTEGVVDSAVEIFENAMANAKAVLDNPDATVEEIYDAWNDLLDGIWGLGLKQGDKAMLEQLISRADVMMSEADKFADTNWQQLVDALAEAKTVYDDGDAMQEDVDAAAEALLNAILAQRYEADKSILEDLINQANEVDTSLYTAESVQVFTAALKSANAILADESLDEAAKAEDAQANQAVIDEAVVDLQSALDNLVEASADDSGNTNTGDDANKGDDNTSTQDPNKGPMDDSKNPATGDNNLIALGALAVLLTSAGAFVVIRKKSRA